MAALHSKFTQYAANERDAEDRAQLIMNHITHRSDLLSPETAEALANGEKTNEISVSRPPTPPESGSTTPRLTIQPCPERLRPYYPPPNYGTVDEYKIYRSSYPQDRHISFVRGLGINSVLTLVDTEPSLSFQSWVRDHKIRWAKFHIDTNKDKSGRIDTSLDSIYQAVLFLMDGSNYPIYVHCNQGKHRTGCVIACLRKVQGWSVDDAIKEYNVYAGEKVRPGDHALITAFDPNQVWEHAKTDGTLDALVQATFRSNRILRDFPEADVPIVDINSLRIVLDIGVLGDVEPEYTGSSGSSAENLSPPPPPSPSTIRVNLPGSTVQAEVQMSTNEHAEGVRIVGEDMITRAEKEEGNSVADRIDDV